MDIVDEAEAKRLSPSQVDRFVNRIRDELVEMVKAAHQRGDRVVSMERLDTTLLAQIRDYVRAHPREFRAAGKHLDGQYSRQAVRHREAVDRAAVRRTMPPGAPIRSAKGSASSYSPGARFALAVNDLRRTYCDADALCVAAMDQKDAHSILLLTWLLFDTEAHVEAHGFKPPLCEFQQLPWATDAPYPSSQCRMTLAADLCDGRWIEIARAARDKLPPTGGGGGEGATDDDAMGGEEKVLALLVKHPDWTDTRLAEKAGVNRGSLYRMPKFVAAKRAMRGQAKDNYQQRQNAKQNIVK